MVYLEKKRIKSHIYWYAVEKKKIDGKVKRVWQQYLGTAEMISERMRRSKDLPHTKLKSFEYGKTAALLDVNQDLDFVEIVDKHARKKRLHGLTVGEYMLLIILGRCDKPLSRNAMARWFKNSAMSLLWRFRHKLSCQNFLNHMQQLDKVREGVEDDLAKVLVEKGLTPSTLILDTSNFYTYIEHGEKLLQKGKSKHHRDDKNLVALGLVVSEDNIPFLHDTYEANNHDAKQFPEMLDKLVKRLTTLHVNLKDIVLVCDKGNNSRPNIAKVMEDMHVVGSVTPKQAKNLYLFGMDAEGIKEDLNQCVIPKELRDMFRSKGFSLSKKAAIRKEDVGEWEITNGEEVCIIREKRSKLSIYRDILHVPVNKYSSLYTNQKGHEIKGYRVKRKLFGLELTLVVSYNEPAYRKQSRKYDKDKQKIFSKLRDLNRRLNSKKAKERNRSSVEREINDIIRKNMRSVIRYSIKEEDNRFKVTYWTYRKAEKERRAGFGKTLVFTDMHHWHSKKIVKTYNSKYLVEDDFKWFNDTALISMKPIFARLDRSIRVHVFLCVMGMLFYRYLFWKLRSFNLSGQRILEELKEIRISIVKQNGDKKANLVFEEMTPLQSRLFSSLDLGRFIDT